MADPKAMTLAEVRSTLTGESAGLARRRRAFRRIPSPPRCKLCAAPFAGVGGLVLRPAGFKRSPGNPALCTKCVTELRKRGMSGVEIPVTLLFSDVRGSTAMGERLVNTTARLASAARAGEVIVSVAADEAAGVDSADRRTLEIRGREEPVEVVVLRPAEAEISATS
jgi:hypothetical protein